MIHLRATRMATVPARPRKLWPTERSQTCWDQSNTAWSLGDSQVSPLSRRELRTYPCTEWWFTRRATVEMTTPPTEPQNNWTEKLTVLSCLARIVIQAEMMAPARANTIPITSVGFLS